MAPVVKNPPANAGDTRNVVRSLGQEDPLEKGNGSPFQYPCLENPMCRGTWWATVPKSTVPNGVTKSWTRLSRYARIYSPMCACAHTHTHMIDAHSLLRAANLRALREVLVAQWLEQSLGGILISPQLSTNTDRSTPYWEFVLVRISRFHMKI